MGWCYCWLSPLSCWAFSHGGLRHTRQTSRLAFLHSGAKGQTDILAKSCWLLPPLYCFTLMNPLIELLSQRNFSEASKMAQVQLMSQPTLLFSLGQMTSVQQSCLCNKKSAETHSPENSFVLCVLMQFSCPLHFSCFFGLSNLSP